jgi:hypothetical protein
VAQQHGVGYDAAVRAVQASDPRWTGGQDPQFDRRALTRFAHALAFAVEETPRWVETVTYPGLADTAELEVRVLTASVLAVVTTPWSAGGDSPEPTVKLRPLRLLNAIEVDGFVFGADGLPAGCTITLLFEDATGVRLGAAAGADRSVLATMLPALRGLLIR